jgi:beta-glucanase (GH16 family)
MVSKAKSTQKTKLEVSIAPGGAWTKIAGATAIPRGTGTAQWLEVTDYDSDQKEYIPGLADVTDVTIVGRRVVDDAGQNIVRDAYYTAPRSSQTLYFRSTTAQGEVFTFESEVGSWSIGGDPNQPESFNAGVRPKNEAYAPPAAGANVAAASTGNK